MQDEENKLRPLIIDKANVLDSLMVHGLPSQSNICFFPCHPSFLFATCVLSIFAKSEHVVAVVALVSLWVRWRKIFHLLIACIKFVSHHAERLLCCYKQALYIVFVLATETHILPLGEGKVCHACLAQIICQYFCIESKYLLQIECFSLLLEDFSSTVGPKTFLALLHWREVQFTWLVWLCV